MGVEAHVGVLDRGVLIALRGEGDVAAVGEEHAVFLHGTGDDPGGGRKLRHVVRGLQAEVRAHRESNIRSSWSTGMRRRMHEDVGANPRIGKDEANGVVDTAPGEFVGIEDQRRDGESGGIDAGTLIATPGWRVDAIQIPHHKPCCKQDGARRICLVRFVELALSAVHNDQVAITLIGVALIAGAAFDAASDGKRDRRDVVRIGRGPAGAFVEMDHRCGGVRLQHAKRKIDLHSAVAPPTGSRSQLIMSSDCGSTGSWLMSWVQMVPGGK